jgi:hypothetical protein
MLPPELEADSDGISRCGRIRRADDFVQEARLIAGAVEVDPKKLSTFRLLIPTKRGGRSLRGRRLYEWYVSKAQNYYASAGLCVLAKALAHVSTLKMGLDGGGWKAFDGRLLSDDSDDGWWHPSAERVPQ